MAWQELTGYLAGCLTMFAVIPQISKAWKSREVNDISIIMVVTLICGLALWTTYGILTTAWPVIITNGIGCLLNCFLLGLVLHERRRQGPTG